MRPVCWTRTVHGHGSVALAAQPASQALDSGTRRRQPAVRGAAKLLLSAGHRTPRGHDNARPFPAHRRKLSGRTARQKRDARLHLPGRFLAFVSAWTSALGSGALCGAVDIITSVGWHRHALCMDHAPAHRARTISGWLDLAPLACSCARYSARRTVTLFFWPFASLPR